MLKIAGEITIVNSLKNNSEMLISPFCTNKNEIKLFSSISPLGPISSGYQFIGRGSSHVRVTRHIRPSFIKRWILSNLLRFLNFQRRF